MDPDKKQIRKLKRVVKRAGTKRRRQHLKRELTDNPEEAPFSDYDFGSDTSATLNGLDQDSTRKRKSVQPPPGTKSDTDTAHEPSADDLTAS